MTNPKHTECCDLCLSGKWRDGTGTCYHTCHTTPAVEKEKCRNCEITMNGQIIQLDDKQKCVACGRQVGSPADSETAGWEEEFYRKFCQTSSWEGVGNFLREDTPDRIISFIHSIEEKAYERGRKEAFDELWVIFDTIGAGAMLEARNLPELVKQACKDYDLLASLNKK